MFRRVEFFRHQLCNLKFRFLLEGAGIWKNNSFESKADVNGDSRTLEYDLVREQSRWDATLCRLLINVGWKTNSASNEGVIPASEQSQEPENTEHERVKKVYALVSL